MTANPLANYSPHSDVDQTPRPASICWSARRLFGRSTPIGGPDDRSGHNEICGLPHVGGGNGLTCYGHKHADLPNDFDN
jgi:hypothetical protein